MSETKAPLPVRQGAFGMDTLLLQDRFCVFKGRMGLDA